MDFLKKIIDESEKQIDKELNEGMAVSDIQGTDNPGFVDWASGKGPETDLGKRRAKDKKKKKKKDRIVRRTLHSAGKM